MALCFRTMNGRRRSGSDGRLHTCTCTRVHLHTCVIPSNHSSTPEMSHTEHIRIATDSCNSEIDITRTPAPSSVSNCSPDIDISTSAPTVMLDRDRLDSSPLCKHAVASPKRRALIASVTPSDPGFFKSCYDRIRAKWPTRSSASLRPHIAHTRAVLFWSVYSGTAWRGRGWRTSEWYSNAPHCKYSAWCCVAMRCDACSPPPGVKSTLSTCRVVCGSCCATMRCSPPSGTSSIDMLRVERVEAQGGVMSYTVLVLTRGLRMLLPCHPQLRDVALAIPRPSPRPSPRLPPRTHLAPVRSLRAQTPHAPHTRRPSAMHYVQCASSELVWKSIPEARVLCTCPRTL
ncbi:hypothetical protein DENSPDRAFT_615778 [Dentipellis sp. KUC8613]|nr:hypothetical protein DENSPDRAFT_615778 [Dentipellis sp. KUC8613]